jgi:hypothetical protein
MIANAVQCFDAQVERNQCDIGAPERVIEAMCNEWRECVLAGVTTWAMPAIVPKRDGFGKHGVEPECTRDSNGHLRNLESVCKPSALMILGEDEDLSFSCETTKCGSVKNAIAVALEARAIVVGLFGDCSVAGAQCASC